MRKSTFALAAALVAAGCENPNPRPDVTEDSAVTDAPPADAAEASTPDVQVLDGTAEASTPEAGPGEAGPDASGPRQTWCSLGENIPGITVPDGFCVRRFARIGQPRTMVFAPNGDLFVGAPRAFAPGGSNGGPGAVVVYSDDDRNGQGEEHMFITMRLDGGRPVSGIPDVHGIALGGGYLYFTTQSTVFRVPYTDGLRAANTAMLEDLRMPSYYAQGRWTHGLARSVGGSVYTSGGMVGQSCGGIGTGGIYRTSMATLDTVSDGYRNPMYLRCHFRDEVCIATELGEDQTPGAREKIVVLRNTRQNYGYPCCYTRNLPMSPQCESIAAEDASFPIGDTPFGLDWERGNWPEPFRNAIFVAMHGSFYTSPPWLGAGVRYWPTNPTTHEPTGAPAEFMTGVGFGRAINRPAEITFSPDGRMFVADDMGNAIYWVAPTTLEIPAR